MSSGTFHRNTRARGKLELFFLAAASSLLLVRFYLHMSGYPQIGAGGLHIAHVLWGGLLMTGGIAVALTFIGNRAQRLAAILGGVGFGVFVDEIGKFITRDNNYFYQPSIGIIYAIFTILYLIFNFLGRNRPLTSREYQLNALAQLEEAVVRDLDPVEKTRVQQLIDRADPRDPLTAQLQQFLNNVQTIPTAPPRRHRRIISRMSQIYARFWRREDSGRWVRVLLITEVVLFAAGVSGNTYSSIRGVLTMSPEAFTADMEFALGQLGSAVVAVGFVIWGAIILRHSRMRAYEQFRRATLVNLFLTEFFIFARTGFDALPGFFFNLTLLALIGYAIRQEQQAKVHKP